MAFEVASLVAKFQADISNFKSGVNQAKKLAGGLTGELKTVHGALDGIGSKFISWQGAIAGVGLTALTYNIAKSGAELERMEATLETVADNMGYSAEQVQEFRDSLKEVNTHGRNATSTITTFLQSGIAGQVDFKEFIGVTKDFAASMGVSSGQAIGDFTKAITTLRPELLSTYGIQFNLNHLYKQQADALGKTTTELSVVEKRQALLNEVFKQGENVAGVYNKTYDTSGKNLLSLQDAIQNLKDIMGMALVPAFKEFTAVALQTAKDLRKWFEENEDVVREWSIQLGETAKNIINVMKEIGKFIVENRVLVMWVLKLVAGFIALSISVHLITGVVTKAIAVFKVLKSLFLIGKGLMLAFSAASGVAIAPLLGIIAAIGVLIGIGYLLYQNWDLVVSKAKEFAQWVGGGINSAIEWAKQSFNSLIESIRQFGSMILEAIMPVIQFFTDVWKAQLDTILMVWNLFVQGFKAVWDAILYPILFLIYAVVKTIFTQVGQEIMMALTFIRDFIITPFANWFAEKWEWIRAGLEAIITRVVDNLTWAFHWINDMIIIPFVEDVITIFNVFKDGVMFVFNTIKFFLMGLWYTITTYLKENTESTRASLIEIWNRLVDGLKKVGTWIFDAITKPFRDAWEAIKKIGEKIKETAQSVLDWNERHSPSIMDRVRKSIKDLKREYGKLDLTTMFGQPAILPVNSPVQSMSGVSGVGGINIYMNGSIGNIGEAQRIGEMMGDQIIGKLKQNIRF